MSKNIRRYRPFMDTRVELQAGQLRGREGLTVVLTGSVGRLFVRFRSAALRRDRFDRI